MLRTLFLIASLVGAMLVIGWRMREAQRPVTLRKIIIPPLGMSTGFCMFFYPPMQVPLSWAAAAFALGAAVLAYPLVRMSRLTVEGDQIMVRHSRYALMMMVGLVAVRVVMRSYIEQVVPLLQSSSLVYLLAFGMIVRWRVGMLLDYQSLRAQLTAHPAVES